MDRENPDDKPKEAERCRAFYRDDGEAARIARGWYYHSHLGLQGPFADQAQADLLGIEAEDEAGKVHQERRPGG